MRRSLDKFAKVVPAFKYVATGKRVSEGDFSTAGKLFYDKQAVLDFLDLWCSAEIVRDVFFNDTPTVDLGNPEIFNVEVQDAVAEYHGVYGLAPNVLAWRDVLDGEIARVKDSDGNDHYPPVNEFSVQLRLEKDGYQGDRFMGAVRSAIAGFVIRDDEVLLYLLNQVEPEPVRVDRADYPGKLGVISFSKAREVVWNQAIPMPTMITTPHMLRELYLDEKSEQYVVRPEVLTGTVFGSVADVELRIVEPVDASAHYVLGCSNIQTNAMYGLGTPSTLGVRHVKTPVEAHPARVEGDDILLLYSYIGTWLQGKGVGKVHAVL
jgi:hypothetical protein